MASVWKREYILRANDSDKFGRIKPSAVLELFQDAASLHAEELGVGFDDMTKNSHLWVLTRTKFKIISNPRKFQKLIVKTWPLKPGRLIHRRECCIEDENGTPMIIGSSEWVVIHSESRRPVSAPELYSLNEDFCTDMMLEEKFSKVPDFEENATPRVINAGFSELDSNNHINNTKYANYILDAVSPSASDILSSFQIDYRKEVLEGTRLYIYHKREGGEILAKGLNDNGDVMFSCSLEYKTEGE